MVSLVALALALSAAPASAATSTPAPTAGAPVGDGESSAATDLLFDVAKGAAGEVGSSLVGWVLGSSGSADQQLAVMNEILDELDTIENTLVDIENELAAEIQAIDQLDCDTWVQEAAPMANAISNLWDPNSVTSAPGDDPPPPQQSYVGMVAEAKSNTLTNADMQAWVDQVLNNNGQGINGQSTLNYLQNLSNALIPPAGGSGVLKSCLTLPSSAPSQYKGKTDDEYYGEVVAPLIDYYYSIQAQGVTMVVEALNYEAWQAAGSPVSTAETIDNLPESICGPNATGQVLQFCQNAEWAVWGTDGQSGVRARLAAQLTLGGAPYTTDAAGEQPVHRYVTSESLYASSPSQFQAVNSPDCAEIDSAQPCGILSGIYSDTQIGGTYGGYGAGFGGTWAAASGPNLTEMMDFNSDFEDQYANLGDFLEKEHRFVDLPDNTIFVTNQVFSVRPYSNMTVTTNVITFTDTGLVPQHFFPLYNPQVAAGYINVDNSLQVRTSAPGCQFFGPNPYLPAGSENGNFYQGTSEFCPNNTGEWTSGPPGWTTDVGAAAKHPQFRMPAIDITTLTCAAGLSNTNVAGAYTMCGNDFYTWLDARVPPAQPRDEVDQACEEHQYRFVTADGTTKCRFDRTWAQAKRPERAKPWWSKSVETFDGSDTLVMDDVTRDVGNARPRPMTGDTGSWTGPGTGRAR